MALPAAMTVCHNIPVLQASVFVIRGAETKIEAVAFCCPMDTYRKVCWKPASLRYRDWKGEVVESWFKPFKECTISAGQWEALSLSGPYYGMSGFGYYLEVLPDGSWKAHPGNRSMSAALSSNQPTAAPKEEKPTHPGLNFGSVPSHGYERIDRLAGNAYIRENDDPPF